MNGMAAAKGTAFVVTQTIMAVCGMLFGLSLWALIHGSILVVPLSLAGYYFTRLARNALVAYRQLLKEMEDGRPGPPTGGGESK